jgi:hypothetical protein
MCPVYSVNDVSGLYTQRERGIPVATENGKIAGESGISDKTLPVATRFSVSYR